MWTGAKGICSDDGHDENGENENRVFFSSIICPLTVDGGGSVNILFFRVLPPPTGNW